MFYPILLVKQGPPQCWAIPPRKCESQCGSLARHLGNVNQYPNLDHQMPTEKIRRTTCMKHHETIYETQNSKFLNKLMNIEPLTKHLPQGFRASGFRPAPEAWASRSSSVAWLRPGLTARSLWENQETILSLIVEVRYRMEKTLEKTWNNLIPPNSIRGAWNITKSGHATGWRISWTFMTPIDMVGWCTWQLGKPAWSPWKKNKVVSTAPCGSTQLV